MRRLIINADDFGLTSGVNRAISECCRQGVVTSTTLMANSRAFTEAVTTAREFPSRASVGCHIVLVDGEPLLPGEQVSSLLSDGLGAFRNSIGSFAMDAMRGRIRPEQIEAEAIAQIRKIQSAGLELSHFDTHKHAHFFPPVLKPLLRAARTCGVRTMRNPFAPVKPLAYAHLVRRPHLWKRYTEVKVLRGWADSFRRAAESEGIATTDGTFGIVVTGALDETLFSAIMGCIPEGTWEFCCHPGYNDAELATVRTRLRESRESERAILTSEKARRVIAQHGIELISYRDLQ